MTLPASLNSFLSLRPSIIIPLGVLAALVVPHTVSAAPAPVSEKVKDVAGKTLPIPNRAQKATVLVFVAHDCPISNGYAPEISRIAREYALKGVQLTVVYAENGLNNAGAKEHARQYGYKMPLVLDASHRLSGAVGATVTPEAVVLSPAGKRLYLGRIDNKYAAYGKSRSQATQRDLRAALDAVVAGKPVVVPTTTAIGCFIPTSNQ